MEGAGVQSNSEVPHDSAVENSEDTPLIEKIPPHWSVLAVRYRNARKCISSKAALLILFWSFAVSLANELVANPDTFMQIIPANITLVIYGVVAFVLIFYPLAGYLADVKFGHYKTVLRSLYFIIPSLVITMATWATLAFAFYYRLLAILIGSSVALVFLFFVSGFNANVIQFGMDQLHDSPGEDRTLFIHWYVWVYYVSVFITQLAWNLATYYITDQYFFYFDPTSRTTGVAMIIAIPVIAIVLLIVSACLGHRRRRWFLIEPGRVNPYKLVYRVSKFAYQHRIPVQRSAFTYCEDELPSGLDLGKDKYGGPFTTEEVEDVKAFYGILKVLFSFGMAFFLDFAAKSTLPLFALHNKLYAVRYDDNATFFEGYNKTSQAQEILINKGVLSPLLVVVCIPLYLFLLRPFISYYIPGMLKRMGIGMCLVLLSLMFTFSLDTAIHSMNKDSLCMFKLPDFLQDRQHPPPSPELETTFNYVLVVQNILSALSNMLIYIADIEFICSQSPHSMKGLLIGLSYAIKRLYQMLAAALVVPYIFWDISLPSCGFGYYLMNILIGVFAVAVCLCVAKRYKYRERDEPCHVRRYAEEYYSNTQQERYYDYD